MYINTILPSTPRFLLQISLPKPYMHLSFLHTWYTRHLSHSSWFDASNNIWVGMNIMKFLIMQSSPIPYYLVPRRHKYLPQYPIFKHPQPMFLSVCKRFRFLKTAYRNDPGRDEVFLETLEFAPTINASWELLCFKGRVVLWKHALPCYLCKQCTWSPLVSLAW